MEGQYRKIKDFEDILWDPESPVLVEKMRLAHDRIYGTNVLQITFRNTTPMNIYGLSVRITLRDESGKPIYEEVNFNYYGMETASSRTFGGDDDIIVEPEAVDFDVTVLRADLSDGQYYRGAVQLRKMPAPQALESLGEFCEPFQERLLALQPKVKLLCAPEDREKYWRCVCKRLYPRSIDKCPFCRLKAEKLLEIVPTLRQEKKEREAEAARLEKERLAEEERQRLEEEQRREEEERIREQEEQERKAREEEEERQRKKRKKRIIRIAASAACLVLVAGSLLLFLPKRPSEEEKQGEQTESPEATEVAQTVEVKPSPVPAAPEPVVEEEDLRIPIVILGADLTPGETRTIWRLFSTTEEKLGDFSRYSVTAEQNHLFMDIVLGSENTEERALSSMLIVPTEKGSGVHLSMYNINYCDEQTYLDAFAETGMTDVNVVVAAPQGMSGAAALTGLYCYVGDTDKYIGTGIGTAVSRTVMNVRCGDSTAYERYGTIPVNTEVEVLEILDNGWYKIVWPYAFCGYAYTSNTNNNYYTFTPNEANG